MEKEFRSSLFYKSIIYFIIYIFMVQSCVWITPNNWPSPYRSTPVASNIKTASSLALIPKPSSIFFDLKKALKGSLDLFFPSGAYAAEPVAVIGENQSYTKNLPIARSLSLNGAGAYDPDGDALAYQWYGPFQTTDGLTPTVNIPEGSYTVSLTVDDGIYRSKKDTAVITISPCFSITARAKVSKVQLVWTHIAGTERYDVYRTNESDPFTFQKIAETTSTYSTYLDSPVQTEITYLYVIGALLQGQWCYSNVTSSHPTTLRTLTPVNNRPMIYSLPITQGTVSLMYNYDVNATDPENNTLSYNLLTSPAGMTIDSTSGLISWIPSEAGSFDITVEVTDGNGTSDRQKFTIVTVKPVNDPPVAYPDEYVVDEDTTLTITVPGVLENDKDIDNDSISAILSTSPSNGELTFKEDGSFTYIPTTDSAGTDTFTYTAYDGSTHSDRATVIIYVNQVNDAPQFEPIKDIVTSPGETKEVMISASDIEGDHILLTVDNLPSIITFIDNTDGTGIFTINPTEEHVGLYSVTVRADDGKLSTSYTFSVTIMPAITMAVGMTFSIHNISNPADSLTQAVGQSFSVYNQFNPTASLPEAYGPTFTVLNEAPPNIDDKNAYGPTFTVLNEAPPNIDDKNAYGPTFSVFNAYDIISTDGITVGLPFSVHNIYGPKDLIISDMDSTQIQYDQQKLTISGSISATIEKNGLGPVTYPFEVVFFQDKNTNFLYDPGIDVDLAVVKMTQRLEGPCSILVPCNIYNFG